MDLKFSCCRVTLSPKACKQIQKIPIHIVKKLNMWVLSVEEMGIHDVRKVKGYHDEPLQGHRWGQRSIRLSKAYRAIYQKCSDGSVSVDCIEVLEVNKHEYGCN